jgi:TusA-related sulfurtransferase
VVKGDMGEKAMALVEDSALQLVSRVQVDITGEVCPMTYVRTKLALETLQPGEVLEVLLKGDEPLKNIPRSATAEGHRVLAATPAGPMTHRVWIEKAADSGKD